MQIKLDGMPLQQTWMECPCSGLGWDSLVAAWGRLGWNALVADLDGMPLNLAFRNPTYTAARCQILPISKNLSENNKNLAFIVAAKHLACKYQKSGNYIGGNTPY